MVFFLLPIGLVFLGPILDRRIAPKILFDKAGAPPALWTLQHRKIAWFPQSMLANQPADVAPYDNIVSLDATVK